MSDQNKPLFSFPPISGTSTSSAPAFSFGNSATTTSANASASPLGSTFGQQSGNSVFGSGNTTGQGATDTGNKSAGGIFAMNTPNSSGAPANPGLFGNAAGGANNKANSSLGGTPGGGQTFGSSGAASTGNNTTGIFGANNKTGSGLSLFGQTSQQNLQQGTTSASGVTPISTAPAQKPLFSSGGFSTGTAAAGISSPFGSAGLATPASSKPTFSFPSESTTPAGPPPAKPDAGGNSGSSAPQSAAGLFGATLGQTSASQQGQATTKSAASSGGLFSNLNKPQSSTSSTSQPQTSSTSQTTIPSLTAQSGSKPTGSFGGANGTNTTQPNDKPKPAFSFPAAKTESSSTSGPSTSSLFPTLGTSKAGESATSAPSGGGLFGSTGQTSATAPSTAPSTTGTSGPSPVPMFGSTIGTTKPVTSSGTTTAAATEAKTESSSAAPGASSTNGNAAAALGSSTAGPTPTPQSRLKNKSMDDIITRWATDLAKYQKEFQQQSEKIASWDRMLVENSDKISKLYSRTFQAERDAAEVERQLTTVENQQDELSLWLDRYEKEVDEIMSRQVGQGEGMSGPDQERERTYKMAEKVSERLTEMGQDLTSMIEEINNVSATLSKTSKPDNPLSQIVRILNGHLSLLQQIDEGAASLQSKIEAAQKESHRLGSNGYHGVGHDAADDFYRSFVGRR